MLLKAKTLTSLLRLTLLNFKGWLSVTHQLGYVLPNQQQQTTKLKEQKLPHLKKKERYCLGAIKMLFHNEKTAYVNLIKEHSNIVINKKKGLPFNCPPVH